VKYFVVVNGQEHEVTVDGSAARTGDVVQTAQLVDVEGTPVRMATIADRVYRVLARRGPVTGQYAIELHGFRFAVEALDERTRAIRQVAGAATKPAGPTSLIAPMPGLVVRVFVQPGDRVQPGQGVVVIEAMKMENELRVQTAGVVRAVRVDAGSAVEKGAVLVDFEAAP
jgi:biotin carboxyl carrier protein